MARGATAKLVRFNALSANDMLRSMKSLLSFFSVYLLIAVPAQAGLFDRQPQGVSAAFVSNSVPITISLANHPKLLKSDARWSLTGWVCPAFEPKGFAPGKGPIDLYVGAKLPGAREYVLIGGIGNGDVTRGSQRIFLWSAQGLSLWGGQDAVRSHESLQANQWQFLAATSDGKTIRLYKNGQEIASGGLFLSEAPAVMTLAPALRWNEARQFEGKIADFTVWSKTLSPNAIAEMAHPPSDLDTRSIPLRPRGPEVVRERPLNCPSLFEPQDPRTLPEPKEPPQTPVRKPKLGEQHLAVVDPSGKLVLNTGWELIEARRVSARGETLSKPGINTHDWYDATVPGTVLTTLVNEGVYPDPYYGFNNLAIPETLNKQDWWYRTEFKTPAGFEHRRVWLNFNGINYAAEICLNGRRVGSMKGAFIRGRFDVSSQLRTKGLNALAVRILPPPHPGIPVECSLKINDRPCGGWMTLDGPTFYAAEDWNWIPGIRDREMGIWQDVVLEATGPVTLVDPFVTTKLPLPATSSADLTVRVELRNHESKPHNVTLHGRLEDIEFSQTATVPPNGSVQVQLDPRTVPALRLVHPRLWWPNGYGPQNLYTMDLSVSDESGAPSDSKKVRFGVRQFSYETKPSFKLFVNGQPILCRGGSWGMDDALKRVSRERLEPYVHLERDAHINIIRTWSGQSIEDSLFDLCDEYGIMVWSELWLTTHVTNHDPEDYGLMLANMRDAIKRYRNHPSIVVWGGRNEGWPPPEIDGPLRQFIQDEDGTRFYQPSSNGYGMGQSGPWGYRDPEAFFKEAEGFPPEWGLPSVPTADAIRAMMPAAETWPISDCWAYHDFNTAWRTDYLKAIQTRFGDSASLDDFCRKAQMINYETHRALYESINDKMFKGTTGTMLWMSHPSWPSTIWQLYSSDYDTHGSYYGAMKANELVHVQMNPLTFQAGVVNQLFQPLENVRVVARIYDLEGARLGELETNLTALASACTPALPIHWAPAARSPVQLLSLRLLDQTGRLLSENFYWHAPHPEDLRVMTHMTRVTLDAKATLRQIAGHATLQVTLSNPTPHWAVMAKLTLRDTATGRRILPAYYSDNYVSIPPGEERTVIVECPRAEGAMKLGLDGWNLEPREFPIPRASAN